MINEEWSNEFFGFIIAVTVIAILVYLNII